MRIKTIKEQLIDLGFKTGDKIAVEGLEANPHTIDIEKEILENCLGFLKDFEFIADTKFEKVAPTKEELIEELKKRSKKFEKGKQNYRILYDFELQMVTWSVTDYYLDLSGLIFTKEEVEKVCEELNADREKVKILFDLEE